MYQNYTHLLASSDGIFKYRKETYLLEMKAVSIKK